MSPDPVSLPPTAPQLPTPPYHSLPLPTPPSPLYPSLFLPTLPSHPLLPILPRRSLLASGIPNVKLFNVASGGGALPVMTGDVMGADEWGEWDTNPHGLFRTFASFSVAFLRGLLCGFLHSPASPARRKLVCCWLSGIIPPVADYRHRSSRRWKVRMPAWTPRDTMPQALLGWNCDEGWGRGGLR